MVYQALKGRDYNHSNTLLATSICPDEINTKPNLSLATCLHDDLLGGYEGGPGIFGLGGLAGLPFAGISGMQALFGHAPRNVVVLLGPHIGISQAGNATACGAAIGAGKKLLQQIHDSHDGHPCATPRLSFLDFEEDMIINQLRPSVEAMPEDMADDERYARITTFMYTMSLSMFLDELQACWESGGCRDNVEEITLLAGIIVNQGEGKEDEQQHREDYFAPKLFETWTRPEGGWATAKTTKPAVNLISTLVSDEE
jgi:hypothetical protein